MSLEPYYADDAVTIYHGDCRDVSDSLPFDVLITDPPYGVALGTGDQRRGAGFLGRAPYTSYDDTYDSYVAVVVPVISRLIETATRSAVFVGPHYHELPKADAIGGVFCPTGTGRNAWGFKTFLPVLLYGVRPNAGQGCYPTSIYSARPNRRYGETGHPTPKPIEWMRWLVGLASTDTETVFDPFAGSGSTLRAAKDLGRKAIGVEIEERYCELAAQRCAQEVLDLQGAA